MCALKSLFIVNNLSENFLEDQSEIIVLQCKRKCNICMTEFLCDDLLLGVEYYGLGVGNPDNVMVAVGSKREPNSGR